MKNKNPGLKGSGFFYVKFRIMINIATLNYPIKVNGVLSTKLSGAETLLDADLVIADPSAFESIWRYYQRSETDKYVNAPYFDRFKGYFETRRREIETILKNGKVLVVFIGPIDGFYGDKRGNQSTVVTNYDFLPFKADTFMNAPLIPGIGSDHTTISLYDGLSPFAQYYKAFKEELTYSAYLDIETDDKQFFLRNRSNRPVGFLTQYESGIIAFLPRPKWKEQNEKLISVLINCAKKYLTKHISTPAPNWVNEVIIPGEDKFDNELKQIFEKQAALDSEQRRIENEKDKISRFKKLLYEQGEELENVVADAFTLIGFKTTTRKQADLEHDIVFESGEGRGIAEIEGKDNDAIHIGKLDQLNRVVDEDFELTGIYPQGILIGNHYRFTAPESRKNAFTEKVFIVAKKKSFGLLSTCDLFQVVCNILANPENEEYKINCRKLILGTVGSTIEFSQLEK